LKLDLSESGGQPVGNIQLGDGISALVESAAAALEGESADQVEAWLRESYGPLETYGSAFGKLMARVFGPHGLILLDPREERFHRVAGDIYRRALIEHESLTKELLARNGELEKAGYHSQVKVSPQSTLLFLLQEGKRAPLRVRNGRFIGGEESFGEKDLLELVAAAPERFSPNALLRSVVQDTLLPTVCSVVGLVEVAYYV
jgi:uncharacterized protein YllA (UPF0747 family)